MSKVRFVIPWYGDGIPGGAELACKRLAENLQSNNIEVEVLTTCAKDCYNWQNFHKKGNSTINQVAVRRFKVGPRNAEKFDLVNAKLMSGNKISVEEEQIFIKEMINSPSLYDYIANNNDGYYFFIPYMFGTTFYGSQIHPDRSFLIPCLHDESYAYLDIYKRMFEQAKGTIALSHGEKILINRLFDLNDKVQVFGLGVDNNFTPKPSRFRKKYNINFDFILYTGRKEVGKNVKLLLDYFSFFKRSDTLGTKLILIGGGKIDIPTGIESSVIDLGFVPEDDKYDAYSAALVHCQPSVNESFSFTIMESWLSNTAVLVHENCEVTKDHCTRSNGGLYFNDALTFMEAINFFINNEEIRNQMAQNGKDYVIKNYNWNEIASKYKNLIAN